MSVEINTEELMDEVTEELEEDTYDDDYDDYDYDDNYDIPFCDEEDLLEMVDDDFEYQIKQRGKDYYNNGNVIKVYKSDNQFYAKVKGSNSNIYNVKIDNSEYRGLEYECDCPYEYPCKHEYAVLMAITNGEYEEISLAPNILEKKISLYELIEKIPANKIKEYLLLEEGNTVTINQKHLENHFSEYLPKQKYEYYYNNLYNELILNIDENNLTEAYLNKVKNYIDKHEFSEGYKIIKSIIEAYKDTDELNTKLIDYLPKIGMFLRIIDRKCDPMTKDIIRKWINHLRDYYYYDSYYLEDMVSCLENK